ncbi:MAG: aminoacyl-tRNA hydrolase, partial [Candidatus Dormibacteraceae bacterium]
MITPPLNSPNLLVVGLGNPGAEYVGTRHNLGWACLERLAGLVGAEFDRKRWHSRLAQASFSGHHLWLIEPQTFMNLSGRAVAAAVKDLAIENEAVWVVHDELDLPLGRLRIRRGGSSAGHNGIRSIAGALGGDT